MAVHTRLLEALRDSPNAAVEAAVERALPLAPPDEQRALAQVLLARDRRTGWIALVRCFNHLPEDLQEQLLARPQELFGPLSDTINDNAGQGRANVIDIVRKAADPKLVFLLTETLSDARTEVRHLAARAILEAIRRYHLRRQVAREQVAQQPAESPAENAPGAADRAGRTAEAVQLDPEHLRRAVDFALRQYRKHRNPEIVQAALLFERQQESSVWTLFTDPHDEATRQAGQVLRILEDPGLAPAAYLALGSPLRAAACAGIATTSVVAVVDALAQESFRLLDPLLRPAAESINRPKCLAGVPQKAPWSHETWFDYLRFIDALGLEPARKLPWLLCLNETLPPAPLARPAKLLLQRSLARCACPEAQQAIVPMTCDPDPVVARCAARLLLARRHSAGNPLPAPSGVAGAADWRIYANTLLQSPHDAVRRLVAQALSPGQFERLWNDYLRLPPAVQVTSTRALSETDTQFPDLLRRRLASRQPIDLAQGLKMLTTLPNIKPFREQVIALCGHPDPRIAATAVRLVGRLEDAKLKELLEAAARHTDPRVRANAVAAMDQLHIADRSSQVLALLNSRHHRERANAIRAISSFDFASARECLLKMLQDASPTHRISALWVVGQLQFLQIVRQVGALSRRDPNQHVRKRAAEVLVALQEIVASSSAGTSSPNSDQNPSEIHRP
jgi:HEAT repeat protein